MIPDLIDACFKSMGTNACEMYIHFWAMNLAFCFVHSDGVLFFLPSCAMIPRLHAHRGRSFCSLQY